MKTLLRLIIVLLVLAAGLYLGRNIIARYAVQAGAEKMTGFPLKIGSLDLAFAQSRIAVRDLSLLNPSEFKEPVFVEMPELTVDYDAGSMFGGTPHLTSLVVDLKRIVIVRTKNGESNAMKLKGALGGGGGGKSHYKVDTLRLKIGTVELKDYKMGNPMEKTIALNLDETYRNFSDATDINRLVLLTVLKKAGLPSIGIDMGQLAGSLGNVTNAAGETLKGLTDTLGKTGAGAAETLQKTGKGLFDTFKKIVPGTSSK
ncbi:MAG: hypothetical protein HZA88_08620 [Verrucomicrobia bacterium]|nr:hypothetical protein [Verrucomicrobiota bacterium]